jgi:hypothetical protein
MRKATRNLRILLTPYGIQLQRRAFGGTCRLHLQGLRISEAMVDCCLLQAGFLLGLFFDGKDEGEMFLRNVG